MIFLRIGMLSEISSSASIIKDFSLREESRDVPCILNEQTPVLGGAHATHSPRNKSNKAALSTTAYCSKFAPFFSLSNTKRISDDYRSREGLLTARCGQQKRQNDGSVALIIVNHQNNCRQRLSHSIHSLLLESSFSSVLPPKARGEVREALQNGGMR